VYTDVPAAFRAGKMLFLLFNESVQTDLANAFIVSDKTAIPATFLVSLFQLHQVITREYFALITEIDLLFMQFLTAFLDERAVLVPRTAPGTSSISIFRLAPHLQKVRLAVPAVHTAWRNKLSVFVHPTSL
jgi:hypothetical protein